VAARRWLDLLGRFVHVDKPAKGSRKPGEVICVA